MVLGHSCIARKSNGEVVLVKVLVECSYNGDASQMTCYTVFKLQSYLQTLLLTV